MVNGRDRDNAKAMPRKESPLIKKTPSNRKEGSGGRMARGEQGRLRCKRMKGGNAAPHEGSHPRREANVLH